MNTPLSSPSPVDGGTVDTVALSWVINEIREALMRSRLVLAEALMQDADTRETALRQARAYLHQAHGALQIVDVDGIVILTETVEDLLQRFESAPLELTEPAIDAIALAYQALVAYLEELLAGLPHQPVRLFPYYRALLEVHGAERIHPADLFFPDLSIRPQRPPASRILTQADCVDLRKRFERALLTHLKSGGVGGGHESAIVMRDILLQIETAQESAQGRTFWWVMAGFADAVASGQIQAERHVKQLFARINLQMRRLGEGSSSIAERLWRDALFFLASADNASAHVQEIRAAYRLDGQVPDNYEVRRYGQVDEQSLSDARKHLAQAKMLWSRLVEGDVAGMAAFQQEMSGLAEKGDALNTPALAKLLRELGGIARHVAHIAPGDALSLEIATGLLFVEQALQQITHLPDDFAERADAMTARLLSVIAGEPLSAQDEWLDDMSRDAQQRHSMVVLSNELQSSLRQVEKQLDAFFRDPQNKAGLQEVDAILYQILGALAVLDHDDAVRAVRHIRKTVFDLSVTTAMADTAVLDQIAQNVSALGFFVETLQLHDEAAGRRFHFDDERGVFHADMTERRAALDKDDAVTVLDPVPDQLQEKSNAIASSPTVEDELFMHRQQARELVVALAADPLNDGLKKQLKQALEQLLLDARLLDNQTAGAQARTLADMLDQPDFVPSADVLANLGLLDVDLSAETDEQESALAVPESKEEIDAELLDIFLGEAVEVLACIDETLPLLRGAPRNQEYLTTLRRSFHTLKGSSRMVGLTAFGEVAWSVEQVLNMRLADELGGDTQLYTLVEDATVQLRGRLDELTQGAVAGAGAQQGIGLSQDGRASDAIEILPLAEPEELQLSDAELAQLVQQTTLVETDTDAESAIESLLTSDLPGQHISDDSAASTVQNASPHEHGGLATPDLPAEDRDSSSGLPSIAEVIAFPGNPLPATHAEDHLKRIGELEISLPLYGIYLTETDELVRRLTQDFGEWRHEPERAVSVQAVHAAHSLAGSSVTVGLIAVHRLSHALEMVLQYLSRKPVSLLLSEYDVLDQSVERIRDMLHTFAMGEMPEPADEQIARLQSMGEDFDGRSLLPLEASPPEQEATLSGSQIEHTLTEPAIPEWEAASQTEYAFEALHEQDDAEEDALSLVLRDEIDADLLPVFIEEGRDLLPQTGEALRGWQQHVGDDAVAPLLLRLLHTLKGSARMAGAMTLGQHLHEMETRIENIVHAGSPSSVALDDLLSRYDQVSQLFDQLQSGDMHVAVQSPEAASPEPDVADAEGVSGQRTTVFVERSGWSVQTVASQSAMPQPVAPAVASPLVRVRSDILDRLVNQAGEVSISRSRLENEVGTIRQSLGELSDNVTRLREQLREIEMQAESQIASSMGISADREFDPLEFDRFTRLQELTRMMAESVSDVGTVQQSLHRTIESASTDLAAQANLTRDLQQDLMRVRMVPFASIAERLYRVTRQTGKEMDKRVNLDIRGNAVEIDRSVLEKMTAPFEHLLRNAIVHGIESREQRQAAGKDETGELRIEVRQEGNEVVIQFADDGRGLHLDAIRSKAVTTGLLSDDMSLSDAEVADLIFHPGFSTAEEVTELAGRGVGMDVVRSDVASLGGRITTLSEPGNGVRFTIHLPLTLAVTQVVLISTGGRIYAVPAAIVEQVQQLKSAALAQAYNDGAIFWQSQRVPLYFLASLLDDAEASPVTQQYSPLLILKSGSDRVAIHVDEVIGSREVVVKNIGPQLSRMIGIAGATVLGSGEIVLILNPVPLAQRAAADDLRAPRLSSSYVPEAMGAVAEMADQSSRNAEPVQGLRSAPVVMVVDDSLTVRRVTQRLLTREGYQVVLAKDGVDALQHVQSVRPDVMLVDIEMPRMDGFDLTRNIRGDERTRSIPIIMITSRTAAKHRNVALELGVNAYLGKPYQEDALLELIAGFVGRYSMLD